MNYQTIKLTKEQISLYVLEYMILFLVLGKLFYDSFLVGISCVVFLPILFRRKKKDLLIKRRQKLVLEFKDLILSFSNSLKAGYSIENAFEQGYRDLLFLYEKNAFILKECEWILFQLKNNIPFERLLLDFANRSGIDDIKDFAIVFSTAKRTGGDLNKIIQNTANLISEKIDVKAEINLILSSKKMEQTIMNIVPFLIIFYIRTTSPGYFDSLYKNIAGIVIMSACLLLYVFAFLLAEKIVSIEV